VKATAGRGGGGRGRRVGADGVEWMPRGISSRPGTHRGHISLDLAKQSGHLNFKYGVSPRRKVSSRVTRSARMTREREPLAN